ncbi:MAG TPA: hypothetical protein VHM25_04085 [Polyangiaceae bacterium]|jgi:hypothetical protein|nr:hypothetical protein [Polyangiaceae bacterium]
MKLLFPQFTAPAIFAALALLAGCSSDNPSGGNTAGTSSGGSSSGGKGGSAGSSGGSVSVGGAGSGGAAAGNAGSLGTAGSAGGEPAVEASFATVKNVIALNCFGGGCHSDGGNPFQMKADDTLYASLTSHTTANCGPVINKASPADSALVKVLKGDCGTPPNTTPRMPLGTCFDGDTDPESPCIQPATIAAIQAWIAKGAPQQ